MFADDTAIIIHGKDVDQLVNQASSVMYHVKKWFNLKKLSLSLNKSNFILFHGKGKDSANHIKEIKVGDDIIPRVSHTKYVGLILDERITWENHISELCKSLTKYFNVFYHIRNFISKNLARTIYHACIYPRIKYGIEIYGSANQSKMNKLQVLQNKLMKVLL